ncbi:MAG TPA: response regulator [Anaeromyxobacteraceae bacterium]|nr:response regulator [Anaeromyxobacteraceae bacterium]
MGGARRVFVLDDEEGILSAVGRTLRRAGYAVSTFSSPRAFLDEAKLDPPCCVVLDVHMPEINGVEIQERLASLEQPPSIVFMSGASDIGTSVRAMKAGAIDFLAKPFETRELLEAVDVAIRRAEERLAERTEAAKAQALLSRLTPREREVADLVARGLRSKEIAEELGAAVKTVNIHRSRVMAKLGAATVVELVRLLQRSGQPD